jgi:hypothetical protein
MRNFLIVVVLGSILLYGSASCRRDPFRVNVSGIDVKVNIKRLEQDLFSLDPNDIADSILYLRNKYDDFLRLFGYVIHIGEMTDSLWSNDLVRFCTDKLNYEVYQNTIRIYPDLKFLENEFSDAFRHYQYYFPSKDIPAVYSCITGFNSSLIIGDSVLGIGLDRYLGSDSKYYKELQLYDYQTAKMNPENIITDCMYGWASSEWDFSSVGYSQDNVLTEMIHEGKLFYFVRCMLPEAEESQIFGFNKDQYDFCINNEGSMWQYLIENNLLFNSEQLTIMKLTGEAPFTGYFSKESPGRAAVWIGYRIIRSYMAKNKNADLENLMKYTDIQSILEKARYHPQ